MDKEVIKDALAVIRRRLEAIEDALRDSAEEETGGCGFQIETERIEVAWVDESKGN